MKIEELNENVRENAEKAVEPLVGVLRNTLVEVYMKGLEDCLRDLEADEDGVLVKLKKEAILQRRLVPEEFSVRVWNVLKAMDIYTLGDIVKHNAIDFLKQRNFGKVCFNEVNDYVAKYGYKIEFH